MNTPVACVALDFGGTIATPGPKPNGADVVKVLRVQFDCCAPPGFAAVVDRARREAAAAYRAHGQQTPWETILTGSAEQVGARLPDARRLAEAIWQKVPDAVVDPVAAATVRRLARSGVILVLACNTQRTLATRQRTLDEAGIADCFTALVLSSVLGVGKPDPRFYAAVTTASREATGCGPERVVFVGDTVDKDVLGPRRCGMRPVLIEPGPRPAGLTDDVPMVAHVSELPALLERWP
ncbi:MAG TPA: HAD family hydrolase [Pseudonocardiaceae bacterium]